MMVVILKTESENNRKGLIESLFCICRTIVALDWLSPDNVMNKNMRKARLEKYFI